MLSCSRSTPMHILESQVRYIWEGRLVFVVVVVVVVVLFDVKIGSKLEVAYKIVVVFMSL